VEGDAKPSGKGAPGRRGWRHPARVAGIVVIVVAISLSVFLATRPSATALEVDDPLVGKIAPPIVASSYGHPGQVVNLFALRGHWVLINFFASWCPPCQQEAAQLVAFAYDHRGSSGVRIIGVGFNDPAEDAAAFLATTGAHWPLVADTSGDLAVAYGVRGPPETFLIAPNSRIVAHIDGPVTVDLLDHLLARGQGLWDRGALGAGDPGTLVASGHGVGSAAVPRS